MPRGKRLVYGLYCAVTKNRLGTMRFFKQDKQGKSMKEHTEGMKKYCSVCRERKEVKFKEEKHSS